MQMPVTQLRHCPPRGKGRVASQEPTATNSRPSIANSVRPAPSQSSVTQLRTISPSAVTLAESGIAPSLRQACSRGPKRGCSFSHSVSRGDPLVADQAHSNRNGVVGSSGNKAPATPSPREIQARPSQKRRFSGRMLFKLGSPKKRIQISVLFCKSYWDSLLMQHIVDGIRYAIGKPDNFPSPEN